MKISQKLAALATVLLTASGAEAVPMLQLDIVGGRYDSTTQTIVSNGPSFTLIALLTPKKTEDLYGSYFLSAALTPQTATPGGTLGTFAVNGTTFAATSDMTYGVPPIEDTGASHDGGDLGGHSIYPTYFREFEFAFVQNGALTPGTQHAATYNTALTPGGPSAGYGSLYRSFTVSTNFQAGYSLHFDLYDAFFRTTCSGPNRTRVCTSDEDIDHFAPFSHDAESGPAGSVPAVPEPATLALLATGLAFSARKLRRRP